MSIFNNVNGHIQVYKNVKGERVKNIQKGKALARSLAYNNTLVYPKVLVYSFGIHAHTAKS